MVLIASVTTLFFPFGLIICSHPDTPPTWRRVDILVYNRMTFKRTDSQRRLENYYYTLQCTTFLHYAGTSLGWDVNVIFGLVFAVLTTSDDPQSKHVQKVTNKQVCKSVIKTSKWRIHQWLPPNKVYAGFLTWNVNETAKFLLIPLSPWESWGYFESFCPISVSKLGCFILKWKEIYMVVSQTL